MLSHRVKLKQIRDMKDAHRQLFSGYKNRAKLVSPPEGASRQINSQDFLDSIHQRVDDQLLQDENLQSAEIEFQDKVQEGILISDNNHNKDDEIRAITEITSAVENMDQDQSKTEVNLNTSQNEPSLETDQPLLIKNQVFNDNPPATLTATFGPGYKPVLRVDTQPQFMRGAPSYLQRNVMDDLLITDADKEPSLLSNQNTQVTSKSIFTGKHDITENMSIQMGQQELEKKIDLLIKS